MKKKINQPINESMDGINHLNNGKGENFFCKRVGGVFLENSEFRLKISSPPSTTVQEKDKLHR
jgi:hypothetical protein